MPWEEHSRVSPDMAQQACVVHHTQDSSSDTSCGVDDQKQPQQQGGRWDGNLGGDEDDVDVVAELLADRFEVAEEEAVREAEGRALLEERLDLCLIRVGLSRRERR